jgi:hypothetical protein
LWKAFKEPAFSKRRLADNRKLVFDFKAGRGNYGTSATLETVPEGLKNITVSADNIEVPSKPRVETTDARKESETKPHVSKPSFNIGKESEPVVSDMAARFLLTCWYVRSTVFEY